MSKIRTFSDFVCTNLQYTSWGNASANEALDLWLSAIKGKNTYIPYKLPLLTVVKGFKAPDADEYLASVVLSALLQYRPEDLNVFLIGKTHWTLRFELDYKYPLHMMAINNITNKEEWDNAWSVVQKRTANHPTGHNLVVFQDCEAYWVNEEFLSKLKVKTMPNTHYIAQATRSSDIVQYFENKDTLRIMQSDDPGKVYINGDRQNLITISKAEMVTYLAALQYKYNKSGGVN